MLWLIFIQSFARRDGQSKTECARHNQNNRAFLALFSRLNSK